jgi:hypothetical protein
MTVKSNVLTSKQQKQVETATINAIRAELEMHHSYAVSNNTHKEAFIKLLTTIVDPNDNDSVGAVKHLKQLSKDSSKKTQAAMKSVSTDGDAVHKLCVILWEDRTKQGCELFKGGRSKGFWNWLKRDIISKHVSYIVYLSILFLFKKNAFSTGVKLDFLETSYTNIGHDESKKQIVEIIKDIFITDTNNRFGYWTTILLGLPAAALTRTLVKYKMYKRGKNWSSTEKALSKLIRKTLHQRNNASSSTKKRRR